MADLVCGLSLCGLFGLWPFRFVAVSVCDRFGCGRFGAWPLWPVTEETIAFYFKFQLEYNNIGSCNGLVLNRGQSSTMSLRYKPIMSQVESVPDIVEPFSRAETENSCQSRQSHATISYRLNCQDIVLSPATGYNQWSGIYFTKILWVHNYWNVVKNSFLLIITQISQPKHNTLHATTAYLWWYVQNCGTIWQSFCSVRATWISRWRSHQSFV